MCNKLLILFMFLWLPSLVHAQDRVVIDGIAYRDPLQPMGASRLSSETGQLGRVKYVVTFIRTGGQTNVAVVNGQTVATGDTVDGALVKAIKSDSVTLDVNGSSIDISTFRATFRSDVP